MNTESTPRNYVRTPHGVRAVCEFCDARSRTVPPDKDGEPELFSLGSGWSVAPYPPKFCHPDGSVGSTFACPSCNARRRAGETLRTRSEGRRPRGVQRP